MANPLADPEAAPALWGALFLLIACIAVLLIDTASWYTGGRVHSVSQVVRTWSAEAPVVPFFAGVLIGHLFWPSHN